jgi:hypothetical protein
MALLFCHFCPFLKNEESIVQSYCPSRIVQLSEVYIRRNGQKALKSFTNPYSFHHGQSKKIWLRNSLA